MKLSNPNVGNNFVGFHSSEAASFSLRPVLQVTLSHLDYPPPEVPTNLVAAAAGSSQTDLTWAAAAGAIRYNVRRSSISGGPYTLIAAGVRGNEFSDAGLQDGATYYYVVSAFNGAGESADSLEASTSEGGSGANLDYRISSSEPSATPTFELPADIGSLEARQAALELLSYGAGLRHSLIRRAMDASDREFNKGDAPSTTRSRRELDAWIWQPRATGFDYSGTRPSALDSRAGAAFEVWAQHDGEGIPCAQCFGSVFGSHNRPGNRLGREI